MSVPNAIDNTACRICGGALSTCLSGAGDYLTNETFDIVRCCACDVVQIRPMPGDDVIERYYTERYRVKRHSLTNNVRCKLRGNAATRHFPRHFRGRLLDVGCGDGSFALMMKRAGWDVSVVEIDTAALARLREQGLQAKHSATALEEGFDQKFDAITCWHVLEHVFDPPRLLQWMADLLAPRGLVHITVPNIASWQADWFGRQWMHLDVPRHRYHFSRQTLTMLFEKAGLEPVDWTTFAIEYDWFGFIQSSLNLICSRPNVLFERLTSGARPGTRADAALSAALSPFIAAVTLPVTILSAMCAAGGILSVTCRRR
jgi:2-polyprenyl-3-methyl-5-hydroxy-6-metoxy-1,4-benzoquinol methylase